MRKLKIKDFIFLIIGLIVIIIGGASLAANAAAHEEAISCIGVITDIQVNGSGDDKTHTVYVNYEYQNEPYESILGDYNEAMSIGDEIQININPNNPSQPISDFSIFGYFAIPFGIVFVILNLFFVFGGKNNPLRQKSLIKNGIKCDVEIIEVSINSNVMLNGRSPYIINCKPMNSIGVSLPTQLQSADIWYDPVLILEKYKITKLTAYIDSNNSEKYYIDLSIIDKYYEETKTDRKI